MGKKDFSALIGIMFILLAVGFGLPVMIGALDTPETVTIHQDEDTTVTLTPGLDATLDNVEDGGKDNISVTLTDTESGDTTTEASIAEGDSVSASISGETVTIIHVDKLSNSEAIITYEYPLYFGWSDGAKTVVDNIAGIILLLVILFTIGVILLMIGVFS